MIVPQFRLTQDQKHLIVTIRVPYLKVNKAEFYITPDTFKFYLKPYLLSISLEHIPVNRLKEVQEPAKARYDYEKHLLAVWLQKQVPGTEFQDLDILTKFIATSRKNEIEANSSLSSSKIEKQKQKKLQKVLIEVIDESGDGDNSGIQYYKGQAIKQYSYGFNNNYENVFNDLEEEAYQLFGFNPQQVKTSDRQLLETQLINQDFDADNYLFDLLDNEEEISSVMGLNFDIEGIPFTKSQEPMERSKFLQLLKLPNKQLLINEENQRGTLCQIASVAFAYIYEWHCMGGETGPESAITINRTCPVLACNIFEPDIKKTLVSLYRRCLSYSLYRHFGLAESVRKELGAVLTSRQKVLMILLQVRKLFETSEPRYLLNRIYLDDFAIYVQALPASMIKSLGDEVIQTKIMQKDLDLGLEELVETASENDC